MLIAKSYIENQDKNDPKYKYESNKEKYNEVPFNVKNNNKVVSTEHKRFGIKLLLKTLKRRVKFYQIKLLTKSKN